MSSKPHISIPFSSTPTNHIAIPTPPSSSGSNKAFAHLGLSSPQKFVHPARRRASADSYLDDHQHHHNNYHYHSPSRSPSYSSSLTSSYNRSHHHHRHSHSPQLSPSPGACLVIRSSSNGHQYSPRSGSPQTLSPRMPPSNTTRADRDSISSSLPGDLEFDVEPLSPFSYVPRVPSAPPSRKNSRDSHFSHVAPPIHSFPSKPEPQYNGYNPNQIPEVEEDHTIQLHMMPKNMLLPLPDRNAEMKHLLEHNHRLNSQIRRRLGDERYSQAFDLWTRTRRSEISDHEWLRRSKWFLKGDEKMWNEWAMMVGWDHSRDLNKDEKGEVRGVDEYADKMGHMECLEEGDEE
ncbi:hypothetical protein ABW20_dc0103980 [Dactylellina cionopaga]|nr:hypothetical protein ABW20_dc0103980 [Dactylellina cionopaga]